LAVAVPKAPPVVSQLTAIEVPKPADLIMRQIRNLISDGTLKAGDRLPAERVLAARFGVGRGYVREALRKLEFHGVLQTFPQSGTTVASLGVAALERLISNLLDLDRDDVKALTETRVILEMHAAQLAAQRATKPAIAALRLALEMFRAEVAAGRTGVEEDLVFHIEIARASQNPIMVSLIGLITPDIIRLNKDSRACESGRAQVALQEHEKLFGAIAAHDVDAAMRAMAEHMQMTTQQYDRNAAQAIVARGKRARA
jgi:GntR family transcriptional regulator, transcriptional repressor for pyruvate dehydrogenase complex